MFLTPLKVEECGNDKWRLLDHLKYESLEDDIIVIPKGFVTDFASVPRIPIAFLLVGDVAHRAATLHDYCYSFDSPVSRQEADSLLKEAARAEGTSWWRCQLLWLGVRMFGEPFYKAKKKKC